MTARSTFARAAALFAAVLLLAGIVLAIQAPTKRSTASSAPSAPRNAGALEAAQTPESPSTTVDAGRAAGTEQVADADDRPLLFDKEAEPADPARSRPGAAGMVIGIDPETGTLGMPTPEQLKKLSDLEQQRIDHSPADLVEVHHPDGSVSVDLQGRFQEFATVRIGPDGKKIFQCVDGPENAERVLKSPAPVPDATATSVDVPAPRQPEER